MVDVVAVSQCSLELLQQVGHVVALLGSQGPKLGFGPDMVVYDWTSVINGRVVDFHVVYVKNPSGVLLFQIGKRRGQKGEARPWALTNALTDS